MTDEKTAVQTYFSKLGLSKEVADIYLSLYANGPQNISELSRSSGVERTRIYRLIDTLLSSNLVEVESHYKRGVIKAAPIANLNILISQREQELKSLQDELGLIEQVLSRNSISSPATRAQFYKGAEGVKQMYWNITKGQGPVVTILHENMQIKTNSTFFERWVRKCNDAKLQFRGIVGDEFLDSQKQWYSNHDNERLKYWQQRYVGKDIFTISHGMTIYGNTVAYFNWKDDEIFGVELHNPEVATTQRQFFEMLWDKAYSSTETSRQKAT